MTELLKGTQVLRLKLLGRPKCFYGAELDRLAQPVMADFSALISVHSVLQHTRLAHHFELDEKQPAIVNIIIGLSFPTQLSFDFSFGSSLGEIEAKVIAERERLMRACRELEGSVAAASMEFAQRHCACCLGFPEDDHELSQALKELSRAGRQRYRGSLMDSPWAPELPSFAKYEWMPAQYSVRARLRRDRQGFKLKLLRRSDLPRELRAVSALHMLQRPLEKEFALSLEEADFEERAVDLTIRVGRRLGSDELTVADFVGLG